MAKNIFRTFVRYFRNDSGVAAVEFSLISPFLLFGMIGGGNMAVTIHKHQKAVSAVNASLVFLQDNVEKDGLDSVLKTVLDAEGLPQENVLQQKVKLVLKDGYGDGVNLGDIILDLQCACPDFSEQYLSGTENSTPFYSVSEAELEQNGKVCSVQCNASGTSFDSRVIATVSLGYETSDIFGRDIKISEKLSTRLR